MNRQEYLILISIARHSDDLPELKDLNPETLSAVLLGVNSLSKIKQWGKIAEKVYDKELTNTITGLIQFCQEETITLVITSIVNLLQTNYEGKIKLTDEEYKWRELIDEKEIIYKEAEPLLRLMHEYMQKALRELVKERDKY